MVKEMAVYTDDDDWALDPIQLAWMVKEIGWPTRSRTNLIHHRVHVSFCKFPLSL